MPGRNRHLERLLEYLYGHEERIENLEQNRPGETPLNEVVVVSEESTTDDSVSVTQISDFEFRYDDSGGGGGYDRSQYADESGGI